MPFSSAYRLLLSGVWNAPSLAPAYAWTRGYGAGFEPLDGALAAVSRVLPRFSRNGCGNGTAPEEVLRQARAYLDVAGDHPRLLAPEKRPRLPFHLARSVGACPTRLLRPLPSVTLPVSRGS
jgi:hypothetical protein